MGGGAVSRPPTNMNFICMKMSFQMKRIFARFVFTAGKEQIGNDLGLPPLIRVALGTRMCGSPAKLEIHEVPTKVQRWRKKLAQCPRFKYTLSSVF